ncbi:MAG: helix-turn-helix domain-containing protein [Sporomusaceae bacterium]|nr:helix-turn-helix domain-containing protein [Sporomusaceae bacterium]
MPKSTKKHPSELSITQLNAIDLLASGQGVCKVSETLGVSRHTVTRWKNNPYFVSQLNVRRKENWDDAHERLRGMVSKAIDVMEEALADGDRKVAVEVLKATNIYGRVSGPRGSSNVDEIITKMAEQYVGELLFSQPSVDPQAQMMYAIRMRPQLVWEAFRDMKDNPENYIDFEENEESCENRTESE